MTTGNEVERLPTTSAVDFLVRDDVVDLTGDYLELGIDRAFDLVDEVPLLRSLVGLGRAAMQTRDWLYIRKVLGFYQKLGSIDSEKRREFVERELASPKEQQHAGELILAVVEQSTTTTKASCAGSVLAYCIEHGVEWPVGSRLLEMINAAYLSDLQYLVSAETDIGESGDEVEHLLALGFYERPGKRFGDTVMWGLQPELSTYGQITLDALR